LNLFLLLLHVFALIFHPKFALSVTKSRDLHVCNCISENFRCHEVKCWKAYWFRTKRIRCEWNECQKSWSI